MNSFRSFVLATASVALVFSGCRIEKPATVVPAPPSITSFTSSAPSVAPGGKVTLSWQTTEATSIELREASTGELSAPQSSLSGSLEVTVDSASLFVLVARGPGGSDARSVSVTIAGQELGEITFQALPPVIAGGASSTLAWSAPGATEVSLTADGQNIDVAGQRSSGAITVSPSFDTTYVLTVNGTAKSITVEVQAALLSATVNPRSVDVGDTATVRWTAAGADRVVVNSAGRGQLFETTTRAQIASGSFDDLIPPTPDNGIISYEVIAERGTARSTRSLEIVVGSDLTISRFDAPPVAAAGASYSVRWETRGADQIELKLDGVTIHQSATRQDAAAGLFVFTAPFADFAIELVARDDNGGRESQALQIDAVGIPTSATLTGSAATVAIGQPLTLTFAALEARRARITDSQGVAVFSAIGQTAEGGTVVVYPNAATTYTLSADNLLGNPAVTATASVTVTGTPTTAVQFPPTAISGQKVTISSPTGELLSGFPHTQVLSSTQADFRDISATGTRVLQSGASVISVDLPFSTFLWGKRRSGPLTISRAGWMEWGAPLLVNSSNATSLPSGSGGPGLIAPFWDDLTLVAASGVYVQVVGNAPDETLIVQWDKLQVGTSATSQVTFQAQVHQRGLVSFRYLTMTLPTGPSFLVGLQDESMQLSVSSTATPASNSALYFFSPVTPPIELSVRKGASWGGFVKVGNAWQLVSQQAGAYLFPQDLSLTELMFRPNANVASGQYLEVMNRTAGPLDLSGWELRASGTPFAVPSGFLLQPNVPTVIGASLDPALNDDAGVTLSWGSGFSLFEDGGTLTFGTADASVNFVYAGPADGGRGVATEIDPGPFASTSGNPAPATCAATHPYGNQTPQQLGSQGLSPGCGFGYKAVAIPSHFVDISDGGTRLINSPTSAVDGRTVPITLAATGTDPAPTAFGTRRDIVSMSVDGWLVWGSNTNVSYDNVAVTSTSSSTLGKLAIFWDDMHTTPNVTPVSDLYWKRFAANEDAATSAQHWVFQWAHVRHYNTAPADDLNYEIKLFEDGTIEYHYGTMRSATFDAFATGNSATIWLEKPDGSQALMLFFNQPFVTPNSAFRFVPQ